MTLYQKNGGPPRLLPMEDHLADGTILTNLDREPESRTLLGWVAVAEPLHVLPAEIPMHKARKALRMLGPGGAVTHQTDTSWMELVQAAIAGIADKVQKGSIQDELDTAPNMVLAGATTQMIKTAIGMSTEQLEAVGWLALSLP